MDKHFLTITPKRNSVWDLHPVEFTAAELTAALAAYEVGEKDGDALIPARFRPCPDKCRNQGKGWDCGGGAQHRLAANVEAITMLGGDFDHLSQDQYDGVIHRLQSLGLKFWAYETYSHAPPADCRFRILIALTEEVPLKSPKLWSKTILPALYKALGIADIAIADRACSDAARIYYGPRKANAEAIRTAKFYDGQPFDALAVVGEAIASYTPIIAEPVPADPGAPVELEEIRRRLVRAKVEPLCTMVGNLLARKALVPPPESRPPELPARHNAWWQVINHLARVCEGGEDTQALLSLLRPSWMAEVEEGQGDNTEWKDIEKMMDTAMKDAPRHKAEIKAQDKAALDLFLRSHGGEVTPPPKAGRQNEEGAPQEPWTSFVDITATKEGYAFKLTAKTMDGVFTHHPYWKGRFAFNLLGESKEIDGRPLEEKDILGAMIWLSRELKLEAGIDRVRNHIESVVYANPYDPLKNFLNSLKWDGLERIKNWLVRYMGASTLGPDGEDIRIYVQAIGYRFLVALAARGLEPGCKVDTVLEFEGKQRARKSTALEILGGNFFSNQPVDIDDKDSWRQLSRYWVIELGELETFSRSEVTAQKAFLSKRDDDFRSSYARDPKVRKRRCVFAGTTNKDDYLSDETGNRRHWPITCAQIDLDALAADRDQLIAEAVHVYKAGFDCPNCTGTRCPVHQWWLTDAEQEIADQQTEHRMAKDMYTERILSWFLTKRPGDRPAFISFTEIWERIFDHNQNIQARKIAAAMRRLNFRNTRGRLGGTRLRGYETPADILGAEVLLPITPHMQYQQKEERK